MSRSPVPVITTPPQQRGPATPGRVLTPQRLQSSPTPFSWSPTLLSSPSLVTTENIKAWQSSYKPDAQKITAETKARQEYERSLLSREQLCTVMPTTGSPTLSSVGLSDTLQKYYYDPEVVAQAMCSLNGVVVSATSAKQNYKLRRFFKQLEKIAGGAYASVMKTGAEALVIKTSTDPNDDPSLLHEFIVATRCLNHLRSWIPNFAVILAAFTCSPPILEDKKVVSYCEATPTVNYLVLENIIPSKTLHEEIPTMSDTDFVCAFYQLCLSLRLAYLQCDFSHNDLHSSNVLIRRPNHIAEMTAAAVNDFFIQYPRKGGEILVYTNFIATMIDYGMSHIRYEGRNLGEYGLQKYGIIGDRAFPIFDIYKICMSSANSAFNSGNTQVLGICERIFRYFNTTENFTDALRKQADNFYAPPPLPQIVLKTHDEFLAFFEPEFKTELDKIVFLPNAKPDTKAPILSCQEQGMCLDPRQIEARLGLRTGLESDLVPSLIDVDDNKTVITKEQWERSDAENKRILQELIADASASVQRKGTDWTMLRNSSSPEAYLSQAILMTRILDDTWQISRYAKAGMNVASRFENLNAESWAAPVYNYYNSTYADFSKTMESVLSAMMTNFSADMAWLRGNLSIVYKDATRPFNNIIDFYNAYLAANRIALTPIPLLPVPTAPAASSSLIASTPRTSPASSLGLT